MSRLVGVVLAAGLGTRLSPLTDSVPKALCPVNRVPLVDHAIGSVRPFVEDVAVNVHAHAEQMVSHLHGRVHLSVEKPTPLGTAGALGKLRLWTARRDVLVVNADTWRTESLDAFVSSWDGERIRLLCVETGEPSDFGTLRYVGAALMPADEIERLEPTPSGLYEVVWKEAYERDELDLFVSTGEHFDCGTPRSYLEANLAASGGVSVVGRGALVEGEVVDSVVWSGGTVRKGERLVRSIRVGASLTVSADA